MYVGFLLVGAFFIVITFCFLYFGDAGDSDFGDFIHAFGKGSFYTFGMFLSMVLSKKMYVNDTAIFWTIVIVTIIFMIIDIAYTNSEWDPCPWFSFGMACASFAVCSLGLMLGSAVRMDSTLNNMEAVITTDEYEISECIVDLEDDLLIKYVGFDRDGKVVFGDVSCEDFIEFYKSDKCHLIVEKSTKEIYINSFFNSKEEDITYKFFLTEDKLSPVMLNDINKFLEEQHNSD